MPRYTVSITGSGELASRFESMLDVLPSAAMVGNEETPTATLYFDVSARSDDAAIERAYHRAYGILRDAEVTFSIVRSTAVEGHRPWWRRRAVRV